MKKKEILKIIEKKETILDSQKIMKIVKNFHNVKDEEMWFPKINDLENEFEVLKSELRDVVESVEKAQEYLNKVNELECDHTVRLHYSGGFTNYSECIFCGKTINGDNVNNGNTIYNDINRNKKCVMLDGAFDDGWTYFDGYTLKKVFNIIKDILKDKSDDEEINFINEFKKLNIKDCKIDERDYVKEYYVLIIGGCNIYYINENQYITSKPLLDSLSIAHFLCGIPKVKVELFENNDTYNSKNFSEKFPYKNISNVRFDTYETLDALNKKIIEEKHVSFDLIIDMSELFEYKDNNITKYNLKLKELFPSSNIISISNSNLKSKKELLKFLKEQLTTYNNVYAYSNQKYYYLQNKLVEDNALENEEVKSINLNETCTDIKKLLLKK